MEQDNRETLGHFRVNRRQNENVELRVSVGGAESLTRLRERSGCERIARYVLLSNLEKRDASRWFWNTPLRSVRLRRRFPAWAGPPYSPTCGFTASSTFRFVPFPRNSRFPLRMVLFLWKSILPKTPDFRVVIGFHAGIFFFRHS